MHAQRTKQHSGLAGHAVLYSIQQSSRRFDAACSVISLKRTDIFSPLFSAAAGCDVDVLPHAASKGEALAFLLKQIAQVPADIDLSVRRADLFETLVASDLIQDEATTAGWLPLRRLRCRQQ